MYCILGGPLAGMAHEQQVAEFIGSGYDVFGKYADTQYLKKHIFDTQFSEQYTRTIPDVRIDHYTIEGSSRRQYQQNLAIRVAASADFPLFPASVEAGFRLERSKLYRSCRKPFHVSESLQKA